MHGDDHEPLIPVLFRPRSHIRKRAHPVDAGIGPEIDQHHLPAQFGGAQRRRIEPGGRAAEPLRDGFVLGERHSGGADPEQRRQQERVGLHEDAWRSTSMTALAKASGASCGRLWPMPPPMSRWAYQPVNFFAYTAGGRCGAPFASPSIVIVGTVTAGACASFFSRSS